MNNRKDQPMNRRTVAMASVAAIALALGAVACNDDPQPQPPINTNDPYNPNGNGYNTPSGDYATWVNTVDGLCREERVAWSSGLATAMSGLLTVQFKSGFTPVPNDPRATDFANALANLKAADEAYAAVQTNVITSQAALDTLNAAKTETVRAAEALNSSNCIALATA